VQELRRGEQPEDGADGHSRQGNPIVAVPTPRPALMAGSRGPQAEMVIPPSPNAPVTAQRQRAGLRRADDDDTPCLRSKTVQG
jgi:hypothetical protein